MLFLCMTCGLFSYAQKSTIEGFCKSDKISDINLFTISEGRLELYANTKLAADGSFTFTFLAPYEGFYVIGTKEITGEQTTVYLKPGDDATLNIENKKVIFAKKNTPENIVVAQWTTLAESCKRKSIYFMGARSTYVDFFPEFEQFVPKAQEFAKTIHTKNSHFNDLMKDVVNYETDLFAMNFLRTPRTAHPTKEERPAYYATILKDNYFANDNVLKMLYGSRMLDMYASYNNEQNMDLRLARLSTDLQKGVYLSDQLRSIRSYVDYTNFTAKYGKYMVTPSQKKALEDLGASLYDSKPGSKAADFTYPDKDGKMVSLSDFKGKVVLVDVWATWCGPCKKEIPSLKALEKELHVNKNIVFMGVSVDEEKDKQAWLDMVKNENLEGVQLFASGWSKIAKDYKIKGIPRFMVFSKDGSIYSVDAPRPSDPKLKEMLLKLAAE